MNDDLPQLRDLFLAQAKEIMRHVEAGESDSREAEVQAAMRALALLMNSVRISQGDAAAEALLKEGRRLFHHEGTDDERTDVLAMLCSQESLLTEKNAFGADILRDAFKDGSSVFCRRCQGLVARSRWDAHSTTWCPGLTGNEDEEDISTLHATQNAGTNDSMMAALLSVQTQNSSSAQQYPYAPHSDHNDMDVEDWD